MRVIAACTLNTKLAELPPTSKKTVTHFPQLDKLAVLKTNPSYETEAVQGKLAESQAKLCCVIILQMSTGLQPATVFFLSKFSRVSHILFFSSFSVDYQ